jgi:hypothetical protein
VNESETRAPALDDRTRGVENPRVVDLIALDPQSGEVRLVMLEQRGWSRWTRQLLEIQAKYNSYLSYVQGGFLARDYPAYAGRRVRFELHCVEEPGNEQVAFLEAMRAHAEQERIGFLVRVRLRPEQGAA